MTTVAVIPARYASTRFPGKPLARQTGKYLVQHVYEQVQQGGVVDQVVVATDDERIADAVRSFGGSVCLTREDHPTGTSRVAEAASSIGLPADALVLNVQGDEPEVEASSLAKLVRLMEGGSQVGTLAAPFPADGPRSGAGSPADPNCVKVVVGVGGRALYFSRSLVPYPRATNGVVDDPSRWLLHVGVYAYRVDTLSRLVAPAAPAADGEDDCAARESLEQLAWLAGGVEIGVAVVSAAPVGIDTPEDYAAFVERTACREAKALS